MNIEIIVPPLSQTSDTLILVDWIIKPGEKVMKGDALFSVETDKATLEVESPETGILTNSLAQPGDEIKVKSVIGFISTAKETDNQETPPVNIPPRINSKSFNESSNTIKSESIPEKFSGIITKVSKGERILASPRARMVAFQNNISVNDIQTPGSGPNQSIVENDILKHLEIQENLEDNKPNMWQQPKPIRFSLVLEANATQFTQACVLLQKNSKEAFGFEPEVNDLLALVVIRGLKLFPFMNINPGSDESKAESIPSISLGLAVNTERGMMIPVVKKADQKGLKAFGTNYRELTERARAENLLAEDIVGASFTIINLGMFDIDTVIPVIESSRNAILGAGQIIRKIVPKDDQWSIQPMWTLSLVFDSQKINPGLAARFLQWIKNSIENPYILLG